MHIKTLKSRFSFINKFCSIPTSLVNQLLWEKDGKLPVLEVGVHIWRPLLLIEVISNMRTKVEGQAKEYGIFQRNQATIIVQKVACRQKIYD
jgi:hypothetical protein